MAKFTVHTSIGYVGCEHHDEFEIPDEESQRKLVGSEHSDFEFVDGKEDE